MKKSLASRRRVAVLLIGLVVLVFIGFKLFAKKPTSTQYQTSRAEKGTLIVSVSASGQVAATNNASVTTQASGVVSKVYVQNGQSVKVGSKIAELELDLEGKLRVSQAWASYQSAQNNLDSAKTTLYTLNSAMWTANQKLINDAVARNLTVDNPAYIEQSSDWLAAEAKYKNQQKVVAQAQTSLNSAWLSYQQSSPVIYAPISGIVTGLSLQKGIVLTAQSGSSGNATAQKIASIKTNAPAQLTISLTEIDVNKVKIGDKVTVTLDALPEKTYTGKVISIDTIGSISSGVTSYPAIIGLDSEVAEILPNMAVSAKVVTNVIDEAILVPNSAVQTNSGQSSVEIMKNGKISETTVELLGSNDTQAAIASGVNEGDEVVTTTITPTSSSSRSQGGSVFGGGGFGGGAGRIFTGR